MAAAAGGAALTLGVGTQASASPVQPVSAGDLNLAAFQSRAGQSFQVYTQSGTFQTVLQLDHVTDLRAGAGAAAAAPWPRGERFSVFFRGPQSKKLPQDTYRFTHPQIGAVALFIVPMKADETGQFYEAIFNRG